MESRNGVNSGGGFEGSVAGLSLADIVQMNGLNRFSGCVVVESAPRAGRLWFRDGQVTHAEADAATGEEAFHTIMRWRGGHFSLQPKVIAAVRTIQRGTQALLLESHQRMDEERRGSAGALPGEVAYRAGAAVAGQGSQGQSSVGQRAVEAGPPRPALEEQRAREQAHVAPPAVGADSSAPTQGDAGTAAPDFSRVRGGLASSPAARAGALLAGLLAVGAAAAMLLRLLLR